MKNEIGWKTAEDGGFPMILDEKGLGLKGSAKFFFYFCSIISLLSMLWVIAISIGVFVKTKEDPTLPQYYPMVSIGCIALSMMCMNQLIKFYHDKLGYEKHVEIDKGTIKYHEKISPTNITDWTEKVRKYEAVELRHYNYRGTKSWYIFLAHEDKKRRVVLFAPEYKYSVAAEQTKREALDFYSKLFNIPGVYLDLEASYKKSEEEAKKH